LKWWLPLQKQGPRELFSSAGLFSAFPLGVGLSQTSVHLAVVAGNVREMLVVYLVVQVGDLPAALAEILVPVLFHLFMQAGTLPGFYIT
jgi:hypothetical protein